MSEVKLIADSGGGSVSLKGPATTTGNAALSYILPDVTTGATIQTSNTAGAIVAVKGAVKTDQFTTSVIDTWTDIGLSITHALSNSSNKLLLQYSVSVSMRDGGFTGMLNLMNDTTPILIGDADNLVIRCSHQMTSPALNNGQWSMANTFLYTPGDTSSHVYHIEAQTAYSTPMYINRNYSWNNGWNEHGACPSTLTLMEVAA